MALPNFDLVEPYFGDSAQKPCNDQNIQVQGDSIPD